MHLGLRPAPKNRWQDDNWPFRLFDQEQQRIVLRRRRRMIRRRYNNKPRSFQVKLGIIELHNDSLNYSGFFISIELDSTVVSSDNSVRASLFWWETLNDWIQDTLENNSFSKNLRYEGSLGKRIYYTLHSSSQFLSKKESKNLNSNTSVISLQYLHLGLPLELPEIPNIINFFKVKSKTQDRSTFSRARMTFELRLPLKLQFYSLVVLQIQFQERQILWNPIVWKPKIKMLHEAFFIVFFLILAFHARFLHRYAQDIFSLQSFPRISFRAIFNLKTVKLRVISKIWHGCWAQKIFE